VRVELLLYNLLFYFCVKFSAVVIIVVSVVC